MDDDLFDDAPLGDIHQDSSNAFDLPQETTQEVKEEERFESSAPVAHGSKFMEAVNRLKSKSKARRKTEPANNEETANYCKLVVEHLNNAHAADMASLRKKEPAVAKLQLVDSLVAELRKKNFTVYFFSSGIGAVLQQWLLPDPETQSLPPLTIRSKIIDALGELDFELDQLTTSGLAKTILYLWRMETDLAVRQKCADLCMKWLNEALKAGQDETKAKNFQAAMISRNIRQDAERDGDRRARLYAQAPARSYTAKPQDDVVSDGLNVKIKLRAHVREMLKK